MVKNIKRKPLFFMCIVSLKLFEYEIDYEELRLFCS